MKARIAFWAITIATGLRAAQIPTGTELSIRLTDKVASEAALPQPPVHALTNRARDCGWGRSPWLCRRSTDGHCETGESGCG